MARSNVPLVAVVDETGVMTGVITLDGLLDRAAKDNLTLREVFRLRRNGTQHVSVIGTPEQVADTITDWYLAEAAEAPEDSRLEPASWEVDRVEFLSADEARSWIHPDQAVFIDRAVALEEA